MLADATSGWDWTIFILAILVFLALDLGVFHRKAHVVGFREALTWTSVWFVLALTFGLFLAPMMVPDWDKTEKTQFVTGYIIELSLSMDNVFVIALIFSYFGVPLKFQHRVLFWGILGALLMRGAMIWLGSELISRFHIMFYFFGAFLVFTGIKMAFSKEEQVEPEKNWFIRLTRRFFPVSPEMETSHFTTTMNGKFALTPLALVLVMVETTDLVFAVDSIPAIFAISDNPFIVFTSNVFAILGLRSLYFVLAGAMEYFRYLKVGLSIVLSFIGVKMLIADFFPIGMELSLVIVASIILLSMAASLFASLSDKKRKKPRSPG
jgi:tellurite resistance protein TerC